MAAVEDEGDEGVRHESGRLREASPFNGEKHWLAVQGGYVEVSGNRVRGAAHSAEDANEIDTARAEHALKRAIERGANPLPGVDVAPALYPMKRAEARLDAAKAATSNYAGMAGPRLRG